MSGSKAQFIGFLAMICSAACWGGATAFSKALLIDFQPLPLLVIQLAASVTFLVMLGVISGEARPTRKTLKSGTIGILEPGLAYLFVLLGLQTSSAANCSVVATAEPLFVVMLAPFILRESFHLRDLLLVLLGVGGVLIATGEEVAQASGMESGTLFLLLGTLCAAIYVCLSRRLVNADSALVTAGVQQLYGLGIAVAAWLAFSSSRLEQFDAAQMPLVFYAALSGILQYGMAFWLYSIAIKRLQATQASGFLNLIPIFGLFSAALFLGETIHLMQVVGSGVVMGSLTLRALRVY